MKQMYRAVIDGISYKVWAGSEQEAILLASFNGTRSGINDYAVLWVNIKCVY
jgi:hypothetical protein